MTIAGSTISGNTGTGAGGITSYGPLTITDSTISGNSGSGFFSGVGGILSGDSRAASSLTITDSTISGNSGTDTGGIASYGALDLVGSVVSGNLGGAFPSPFGSNEAGGISCNGTSTITDSQIVNNTNQQTQVYSAGGGGIYDNGDLTITGSTISGDTVDGHAGFGGGIEVSGYSTPANVVVKDCTFRDDQAIGNSNYGGNAVGGAISGNDLEATITISGSSFVGNSLTVNSTVGGRGGALSITAESTSVVDCTFTGNLAGLGGAIASGGPLTISGSSFVDNSAAGGGALALGGAAGAGGVSTGIVDCTFTGNQSLAVTGASDWRGDRQQRRIRGPSPLTISGSTFIDNLARGASTGAALGGAIANRGPRGDAGPLVQPPGRQPRRRRRRLRLGERHGRRRGRGRRLWNNNQAVATVTGSTFLDNGAIGGSTGPATGPYYYRGGNAEGGGINANDGSLTVTGCIIAGNSATGGAASAPGLQRVRRCGTGRRHLRQQRHAQGHQQHHLGQRRRLRRQRLQLRQRRRRRLHLGELGQRRVHQ